VDQQLLNHWVQVLIFEISLSSLRDIYQATPECATVS
jgi:hypothetical protein